VGSAKSLRYWIRRKRNPDLPEVERDLEAEARAEEEAAAKARRPGTDELDFDMAELEDD
jgi:hypothetical protein